MARVIIPLDVPTLDDAMGLVDSLGEAADFYKVGLELFTAEGSAAVQALKQRNKRVFLDLKLHDIPSTVARAVARARVLEVDLLTLHATGGRLMMEAAAQAAENDLTLLGVTVLTSMTPSDMEHSWGREVDSIEEEVVRLATLVRDSGVGGVVASVREAAPVKKALGSDLVGVTPGIRFAGGDAHDQARVSTPGAAVAAGADYLVIGRSVTQAPDPAEALRRVHEEMAGSRAVGMAGRFGCTPECWSRRRWPSPSVSERPTSVSGKISNKLPPDSPHSGPPVTCRGSKVDFLRAECACNGRSGLSVPSPLSALEPQFESIWETVRARRLACHESRKWAVRQQGDLQKSGGSRGSVGCQRMSRERYSWLSHSRTIIGGWLSFGFFRRRGFDVILSFVLTGRPASSTPIPSDQP